MVATTQPPILMLVHSQTADIIELPQRQADLDALRDLARDKALAPDVAQEIAENTAKLLAKLARNPGDLRGLLYDYGRAMYVHGRMDQAADDTAAREQADTLAQATITQLAEVIAAKGQKASAS